MRTASCRYADAEQRQHNEAQVLAVYERGVSAVASVDLWTYYCTYVAEKSDDLDRIRALFERAIEVRWRAPSA
jgi:hypothetical protein